MITTTTVAVSFNLPAEHEAEQKFRISHDMKEWVCLEYAGVRIYEKVERITVDTNVEEGMDELISKQKAIDAFEKELSAKYNKRELAISFVGVKSILENLPSAQPERCEDCENFSRTRLLIPQPEIIRCKDCIMHGVCRYEQGLGADGYCSQAERRTDE